MKYIPNILSLVRLLFVPLFIVVYFSDQPNAHSLALGIYILASATDVLDGYIARKYDLVTDIGTVLDPLADKLMLMAAMICFYIDGYIPMIVLILVVLKESFQIIAGFYLYWSKMKVVIPANKYGKLGTVFFFASIVLVLLELPVYIYSVAVILAVGISVMALLSYAKHYFDNHHVKKGEKDEKTD